MQYFYKIFGYILKSEVPIAQLVRVEEQEYQVELHFETIEEKVKKEIDADRCSQVSRFCGWHPEYAWFRNSYGYFVVYKNGVLCVEGINGAEKKLLLQYVLGYGIAMFVHLQGRIALHCSAVSVNGNAVAISGASGAGKSTITAALVEAGANLLSDDVIAVGYQGEESIPYAFPAFPMQKLCRDAVLRNGLELDALSHIDPQKDKFAIERKQQFLTDPQRLQKLYLLQWYDKEERKELAGKVHWNVLEGAEKMNTILEQLFLKQMLQIVGIPPENFQTCVDLAAGIEMYQVLRPRGENTIQEVVEQIQVDCCK